MRKLVILLSLTTVAFAASTIYLLTERRPAAAAAATMSNAPAPVATPAAKDSRDADTIVSAPPAPFPAPEANAEDEPPRLGELDRRFLADAADPAARARLIADTKANLAAEYQRLASVVGLGPEELDRLLAYLAEQQVTGRVSFLRCRVESIKIPDDCAVELGATDDDIVALIGADRHRRFEKYLMSIPERHLVTRMRGAMPDSQFLSDDQTDRLVAALADENQRRRQELGAVLDGQYAIRTEIPLAYTAGATRESLMADAREHVQRLHAIAAKILTPTQLETYDAIMAQRFGGVEYAVESAMELQAAPEPN